MFVRLIASIFLFIILWPEAAVSQSIKFKNKDYKLVFSDEFNEKTLDTNKWHFRTDSKHWSKQKSQNINLAGGFLQIHLKKEISGDKNYTGGGLISKDTFAFGYYETRMKTPKGAGWHSSFWLMNYDGSGTNPSKSNLEIDILENDSKINLGYRTNLHIWKGTHKDIGGQYVSSEKLNQDFQTVACLYRSDSLFYFYNGKEVDKKDVSQLPKNGMNIWLTCIASFLGGTEKVEDEFLPSTLQFDYVRYYKVP